LKELSEDARRLIHAYVEHGVTVQDAATMAGLGAIERVKALSELRQTGLLTGDTADTLVIKDWAGVLPCPDEGKKEEEQAFLPAQTDTSPSASRCSATGEGEGVHPFPEGRKEEPSRDERRTIPSLLFPSPPISYRYTGAKAAELEYPEPDPGWFNQGTAIAKDRESYWALVEYYQGYADGVADVFREVDEQVARLGYGTPRTEGQKWRNKQKGLVQQAWGVFFRYNHPLTNLYAKKLLHACDNRMEKLLDFMAHVAPRLHLPENFSEKGKPLKFPFAYIMKLIEKDKQGKPIDDGMPIF
jgi:hypothetical protein